MIKNRILLILTLLLILTSCQQKGYVLFMEKQNEIINTQDLKNFLNTHKNPSIVLRVPNISSAIVESEYNRMIYNTIEKELLNSGFNVRDRTMFSEVLKKKSDLSYDEIYKITKTDLILELTHINTAVEFTTNRIYTIDNQEKVYNYYSVTRLGATIQFKIILLSVNKLVGSYTFNYTPCTSNSGDCRCAIAYKPTSLNQYYNYCKNNEKIAYETIDYNEMNEFVKLGIREFINQIEN
jgi:hypothetical protein